MRNLINFIANLTLPFFVLAYYYPNPWLINAVKTTACFFILKELFNWCCPQQQTSKSNTPKKLRPIRVLCIDDDQVNRTLMKKVVNNISENVEIRLAMDGSQGLNMIDSFKPDIVFLDMLMEKMNGNEMVKKVQRRYPKYLDKIAVVTSLESNSKEVTESIFMGCDYIKKPISPEKIRNSTYKILDRYKLRSHLNQDN